MSIYEEVEIEDMKNDKATGIYSYPCPCGDRFVISLDELLDGDDVASCPSCTLRIRVIYDIDALPNPDDIGAVTAQEEGGSSSVGTGTSTSDGTENSAAKLNSDVDANCVNFDALQITSDADDSNLNSSNGNSNSNDNSSNNSNSDS